MLKQILLNDELTTYYISDEGKLFNQKTNRWYKGRINGGYQYYDLRWNGKKYAKRANRLVAEYFLELPENYKDLVVNHKDGNRLNNNVDNLEWCTVSENNRHTYKIGNRQGNGERNFEDDVEYTDEVWKNYKDTTYMISNYGRVKNNKTGKFLKGKITANGYKEYQLNRKSLLAHRLVYSLFNDIELETSQQINHKDGNKLNNHLDNLEVVTASENALHAYYCLNKNPNVKTVYQYDLDMNLLNTYPSCAEAARQNPGCYSNLISNVCNGKKKTHHGYIWSYEAKSSTTNN